MSRQIIKQPNGLYCLFSSISDSIIVEDCTRDELINIAVEEQREIITESIDRKIKEIESGKVNGNQFLITYNQAVELSKKTSGDYDNK